MSNKVIAFHYELRNGEGNVLDKSDGEPLTFLSGVGHLIPGLETKLIEMSVGDKTTVTIPAAEAYGEHNPEFTAKVPRDNFPEEIEVGQQFQAEADDGQVAVVTVTEVSDAEVTIDQNHPLAGMDLTFDVEIDAVRDASEDEVAHGHVHGEGGVQH